MQSEAYFDNIGKQIYNELLQAKSTIVVAVAWFTDSSLFELLYQKALQQVDVKLLLMQDETNSQSGIDYSRLVKAGGKVWMFRNKNGNGTLMHNKFCLIDGLTVITGSYNWTNQARRNHESIIILREDNDTVMKFQVEFQHLVEKAITVNRVPKINTRQNKPNPVVRPNVAIQLPKKTKTEISFKDFMANFIVSFLNLSIYGSLVLIFIFHIDLSFSSIVTMLVVFLFISLIISIIILSRNIVKIKNNTHAENIKRKNIIFFVCLFSSIIIGGGLFFLLSQNTDVNSEDYINPIWPSLIVTFIIIFVGLIFKFGSNEKSQDHGKEGIQDYKPTINVDPNDSAAYIIVRGLAKENSGDHQGAIQEYNQAIAIDPNHSWAYGIRGLAKYNLKDYQGAIEDYTKAIAIDPNDVSLYRDRAISKDFMEDYQGSIEDYTHVIAIDPNAYYNRGIAKHNLKDYQGAISDFTQFIAIDPNHSWAYSVRGNAKCGLQDYQGAIEDFTQAIIIHPNDTNAYYYRGLAKYNIGNHEGACQDWSKAGELGDANAYDMIQKYCQ